MTLYLDANTNEELPVNEATTANEETLKTTTLPFERPRDRNLLTSNR